MRILMISHGYPPTVSGVTHIAQKYSRMLVQLGHQVIVIAASDRGVAYQDDDQGVKLARLRSYRNPYWTEGPIPYITSPKLNELILEFQPDIIHTHENAILSTQLLKLKPRLPMPVISSAYSLPSFLSNVVNLGEWIESRARNMIWKYLIQNLNHYDHVIFSNNTLQGMYQEHGLVSPSSVISNGVDTSRYHPPHGNVEQTELRYNLPPHPRILHVSRLARDKSIDVLLMAMPEVHARSKANLVIVGRGDYQDHIKKVIKREQFTSIVKLVGYIPEEDLPSVYQACDLFTVVSCCETQNIPALQALATGLPLVLVNAGCLSELVNDGENGYLVPQNNPSAISQAINRILEDREQFQQFGQASMEISQPHAESISLAKFINLYENLIAKSSEH